MPKIKSDFNKEIKIRVSEDFLGLIGRCGSHHHFFNHMTGTENQTQFIRSAIIFWIENHLGEKGGSLFNEKDMDEMELIPEVKQYRKNLNKIVKKKGHERVILEVLNNFGTARHNFLIYTKVEKIIHL